MKLHWFHKHKWEEVSKKHMYQQASYFLGVVRGVIEPITIITSRCSVCRKYKQDTLSGHIPLKEVDSRQWNQK